MFFATKEFNFEAGHCISNHPEKCKNVHGHNYKVEVTIGSKELDSLEMVMDFYTLKKFANPMFEEFDHAFIYNKNSEDEFEHNIYLTCLKHERKTKVLDFRSTAENMAKYFYDTLNANLTEENIKCYKVKVYETPTSYAVYKED